MKRNTMVRKWLAALLCACLVFGHFGWVTSAKAEFNGETNAVIRNYKNDSTNAGPDGKPMMDRSTSQVDLLVGTAANSLKGTTLNETMKNYQETYLLDVAADFCVFLREDFEVWDSDAEGRVAIGGDFINNTEYGSYAIGAGDYSHVTELDKLLSDRIGAATFILGGKMTRTRTYAQGSQSDNYLLSDVYYENGVKYESSDEGDKETPTRKSSRKLVLNHNISVMPSWVDGKAIPQESPDSSQDTVNWKYTKVDYTQTYLTQIIDFDAQFDNLNQYSRWLIDVNEGDDFEIAFETVTSNNIPYPFNQISGAQWGSNTKVAKFKYKGSATDRKDCVYIDLTEDEYAEYVESTIIVFENIPLLVNGAREIVDNDGVGKTSWENSYIVINVPNSGTVHVGNPSNSYAGAKVTSINGIIVSRDYPGDDSDDGHKRNNHPGVASILYNFPNASTVVLANNFQGTIFAPNADVTDERYLAFQSTKNMNAVGHGHLSGAIVAKSFRGFTEFGYRPFSGMAILVKGELDITKTIVGEKPDATQQFKFKVTLSDKTYDGTIGGLTFKEGVTEFTLKHGETKKITGILPGTTYTIEEIDSGNYQSGVIGEDGAVILEKKTSGTIEGKGITAVEFVNMAKTTSELTGDLTVEKVVTGNGGDKDKAFRFTVKLSEQLIGKYGDMSFVNGIATFTLKHGETKKATGLPVGITYTVIEEDAAGYVTTKTGDMGTIADGQEAKAIFVNAYDSAKGDSTTDDSTMGGNDTETSVPKTGDGFPMQLWLGLMAIALIGLCVMVRKIRKS